MGRIRRRLLYALDRESARCGTGAQALDLRKHEPHPMTFLTTDPNFSQGLFVNGPLSIHETGQIKRVGHGSILQMPVLRCKWRVSEGNSTYRSFGASSET